MTVWHGDFKKSETSNGESFDVCLAYLSHTPLYKGYGPKLSEMETLREKGELSHGWAEFYFYTDEEIAGMME